MQELMLQGRNLVTGRAGASVLLSDIPLSFMGGVDPATGDIIDTHHPLCGQNVSGKILAIPSGRGSCSGSGVLVELLLNGCSPAGLLFAHDETILTLGAIIAEELFQRSLPIVRLTHKDFANLQGRSWLEIDGPVVSSALGAQHLVDGAGPTPDLELGDFDLSADDHAVLAGRDGEASRIAMRIVLRAAALDGARTLVDVEQAHIDGCFYTGPASLAFAEKLVGLGAQVRVRSTMNAISIDRRRWRQQGIEPSLGRPSGLVADAYRRMGVQPTYTCAPYLLESAPTFGQQIGWAESNAVVYANSVIGARTAKYPDYLDICVALTGRAPNAGCHLASGRLATVQVDVPDLGGLDDAFFPTLGYQIGAMVTHEIPVICGLDQADVTLDDLKAFGAAFATTSAAPMFHIVGITPEAATLEQASTEAGPLRRISVTQSLLLDAWHELNSAREQRVDLVSFGNPHFSYTECERLAALCRNRLRHRDVAVIVTCGRHVYETAQTAGLVAELEHFGVTFVNDTCWCFIGEPLIPPKARVLMTNSAKYAHYGPGAVKRGLHFGSMARCVEAACSGEADLSLPLWLSDATA